MYRMIKYLFAFMLVSGFTFADNTFRCKEVFGMSAFVGWSYEECVDDNGDKFLIEIKTLGLPLLIDCQVSAEGGFGRSIYAFHGDGEGEGVYRGVTAGLGLVIGSHGYAGVSKNGRITGNFVGFSCGGKVAAFRMRVSRITSGPLGKIFGDSMVDLLIDSDESDC